MALFQARLRFNNGMWSAYTPHSDNLKELINKIILQTAITQSTRKSGDVVAYIYQEGDSKPVLAIIRSLGAPALPQLCFTYNNAPKLEDCPW